MKKLEDILAGLEMRYDVQKEKGEVRGIAIPLDSEGLRFHIDSFRSGGVYGFVGVPIFRLNADLSLAAQLVFAILKGVHGLPFGRIMVPALDNGDLGLAIDAALPVEGTNEKTLMLLLESVASVWSVVAGEFDGLVPRDRRDEFQIGWTVSENTAGAPSD